MKKRLRAAALLAALALLLPAAGAGGARAASPEAPSAAQSALRAGSYGRYLAGIAEQPAGEAFTLKASAFTENPGGSASRLTEYKGGRDVLMVADQEDSLTYRLQVPRTGRYPVLPHQGQRAARGTGAGGGRRRPLPGGGALHARAGVHGGNRHPEGRAGQRVRPAAGGAFRLVRGAAQAARRHGGRSGRAVPGGRGAHPDPAHPVPALCFGHGGLSPAGGPGELRGLPGGAAGRRGDGFHQNRGRERGAQIRPEPAAGLRSHQPADQSV